MMAGRQLRRLMVMLVTMITDTVFFLLSLLGINMNRNN